MHNSRSEKTDGIGENGYFNPGVYLPEAFKITSFNKLKKSLGSSSDSVLQKLCQEGAKELGCSVSK